MTPRILFALLAAPLVTAGASGHPAARRAPPDQNVEAVVRYAHDVTLDPNERTISVDGTVRVPAAPSAERDCLLNGRLTIARAEPALREVPSGRGRDVPGVSSGATGADAAVAKHYRVTLPREGGTVHVAYSGPIDFGLSTGQDEYTRGFRSTMGIVSAEGVYLAGESFWYPHVGDNLIEFAVTVHAPEGWQVVSEGNGTARDAQGIARWDSHGPAEEMHLVGGPLQVSRQSAGPVDTQVYLRQPDPDLASKYLAATAQYLEMYRTLIGPYPYGKFALVENFWETGYGMPSFTLLGSRVIRFPFILTSSYPHEILHNWWGNSVFVDDATGNWSEGLTAYMADHLIQEQQGTDVAYRRATLQKYRDYVRDGRDFPLTDFRARHSAATEAVGYGRTLMGFHMLRRRVGDDAFRRWTRRFYSEYRGRRASFADVTRSFEAVTGQELGRFFQDWVSRAGAAILAVSVERVTKGADKYVVDGRVRQTQADAPFQLEVPVVVQTAGRPVVERVRLDGVDARFRVTSSEAPVALYLDPAFDVFRRLDARETPPSVGQIFGESRVLAILPAAASPAETAAYRALVEGWRAPSHVPDVRSDAQLFSLPPDRPIWILGRGNRFASAVVDGRTVRADTASIAIDGTVVDLANHTAVIVRRHPSNPEKAIGFIVGDPLGALPGLGRKLPHYGRYSYLAFEGGEPVNTLKGEWRNSDSPLRVDLRPESARGSALPPLELPARTLATLP
jgi:aminopeptidase N